MIAFVLRETGRDPAWLIGAPVPQLGSNAGAGAGYLVVEGDESDRTVFSLPAEIAVVTNVELDHHSEFALAGRARGARSHAWIGPARVVIRDAPAYDGELALPGELNRLNAGAALAALEAAGVARAEAAPVLARFTGTGRRFEIHATRDFTVVDDYATIRARSRRPLRRRASAFPAQRFACSSSRTCTRGPVILRTSSRLRSVGPTT